MQNECGVSLQSRKGVLGFSVFHVTFSVAMGVAVVFTAGDFFFGFSCSP